MLYRYQSHHLYNLFNSWSENVRSMSNSSVLSPANVIVPNMDLAQWLKVHKAEMDGISANIRFELPAAFLKNLFINRHPNGSKNLLDKNELRWMIFTLLGDAVQYGRHPNEWMNLVNWIERGSSSIEQNVLRWELSEQIADVYDQYILFRPDWLESWSPTTFVKSVQTDLPEMDELNKWQPSLWTALRKRWPKVFTRSELLLELIESLRTGHSIESYLLPKTVHVFGLTTLSGAMTEALILLSRHVDIHWYQLNNETFEHVDASEKNNPFLYNLQRNQRDFVGLLSQIAQRNNIKINDISVNNVQNATNDGIINSTISGIKKKVLNPDSEAELVTNDVESYSIHRCHSARREVEVLHDRLLYHFEQNDFRPGDVAIVSPDPELYAPFVKEVFGSLESGKPNIPIRISGQRQSELNLVADILINGLSLASSRLKSTEVLEWLRYGPVLGDLLDETGLHNTLQKWIIDQRIRWGSDKEHVLDLGFELEGRHTWKHGLDRLLLAWMASEEQDIVYDNILSGSSVLTQNEIRLLSRLITLMEAIDTLRKCAKKSYTALEWRDIIIQFVDAVFEGDSDYKRSISSMKSSLMQLVRFEEEDILVEPISYQVIKSYLGDYLDKSGLGRAWHPGYVTFTGMVALHQIPYKMVAVLGLNDGSLPGRSTVPIFDLISTSYRPGDRVRRQSDQQLFLDYLLTTERVLHLSYTGLRQTDNKPLAPSVMITMLQDFIKLNWPQHTEYLNTIVYQHHLQPFHGEYFRKDTKVPSYSKRNASLSQNVGSVPLIKDWIIPDNDPLSNRDEPIELSVDEMVHFCRNSTRYILKNIHKIDLYESDIPDSDDEPFEVNHLESWQIRDVYFRKLLKGELQNSLSLRRELVLKGIIPDAVAGDIYMDKIDEQLKSAQRVLENEVIDIKSFAPVELDIVLEVNGRLVRIFGNVGMVHNTLAIFVDASSSKPKHCFRIWLQHLLINMTKSIESCVIMSDKTLQFRALNQEEASTRLYNLLWFLLMAETSLPPVFPESAAAYNDGVKKSETSDPDRNAIYSLNLLIEKSSDDPENHATDFMKELSDDWVTLAYGDKHPLLNRNTDSEGLSDVKLMSHDALEDNEFITLHDFQTYEHFTIFAVKVIEFMQRDVSERVSDGD